MAARILHRLRHALAGEGGREERAHGGSEAEDFPESSELEDDTEGLSTRLSGTLSFTSHEEEEDEENEEEDGAGEGLGEPPQATGAAAGAEDGGRCWGRCAGGVGAAAPCGVPSDGGGPAAWRCRGAGRAPSPAAGGLTPLSWRRVGPRGGAPRQQPADPAAAGAVEEVAGQPGTTAAALRGHQRQRGQRTLLQVRGE